MFTVETGFIPTSLAEYFDSVNSNVELAKMINRQPLNSFWRQNNNIFYAQLVMSNHLCNMTGIPVDDSLIITLSYSNVSKCTILNTTASDFNPRNVFYSLLRFKNVVSVPVKCAVLDIAIGQYPNLCGIPEELILHIMTKLESHNLYALMRSCKKMNYIAINNQLLWKKIVTREFKTNSSTQLEEPITDWRNYYYQLKKEKYPRKRTTIIR